MSREEYLTEAFVQLADTLVSDYDVTELLHGLVEHSVGLLDVAAAGILLSDQRGGMHLMASSSEQSRQLESLQLHTGEGPCLDAFSTGTLIAVPNLPAAGARWPRFVPAAAAAGFQGVHALPLRLRADTIGAMNLFTAIGKPSLSRQDLRLAQALAHVATIGILQERAITRNEVLVEQLQGALNSRIIIEQAKGILAHDSGLDMDTTFAVLRGYSRRNNARITDIARHLVTGDLDPSVVTSTTAS